MCSDSAQNGVPSCASKLLMTTKPKEWNASDSFFVVSDEASYWHVFAAHGYCNSTSDALVADFQAGLDILYMRGMPSCRGAKFKSLPPDCPLNPPEAHAPVPQQTVDTVAAMHALTNGTLPGFPPTALDSKAASALRIQFQLGIFDPEHNNPYAKPVSEDVIDGPAHRKVARAATAASIVLVQNAGVLPLSKSATVAAIGPYIHPGLQPAMSSPLHNAYAHSYSRSSRTMVNFLDGLNGVLDTNATFVQGCESNQTSHDDPRGEFVAAKHAAAAADVTVLAVGLTASVRDAAGVGAENEGGDRVSLELPTVQKRLIEAVRSVAKRVVLVIVSGSAVTFNESATDAALYAFCACPLPDCCSLTRHALIVLYM